MKHIIFDLDGTLLDSMPVWKNTGSNFLTNHGYSVPENLLEIVKAQTLPQTAEYFSTVLGVPFSPEEIIQEIISFVADAYRHHIPLKPFAREYLKSEFQKGTKMCILTASESNYIIPALERLDILNYFQFVMTCTEQGLYKDDGAVFLAAMNQLGGTRENTLVFEDALYAVKGAKKAGLTVYAVKDPVTETERSEIDALAHRSIDDFQELL